MGVGKHIINTSREKILFLEGGKGSTSKIRPLTGCVYSIWKRNFKINFSNYDNVVAEF
jgi:hypothetical protein